MMDLIRIMMRVVIHVNRCVRERPLPACYVGATTESTRQSARFAGDLAVLTWIREMGNAN